jgi:hypothetical protein
MASVATLQFNVDVKLDFICVLDPQVGMLAALKNTASIGGSFARGICYFLPHATSNFLAIGN